MCLLLYFVIGFTIGPIISRLYIAYEDYKRRKYWEKWHKDWKEKYPNGHPDDILLNIYDPTKTKFIRKGDL